MFQKLIFIFGLFSATLATAEQKYLVPSFGNGSCGGILAKDGSYTVNCYDKKKAKRVCTGFYDGNTKIFEFTVVDDTTLKGTRTTKRYSVEKKGALSEAEFSKKVSELAATCQNDKLKMKETVSKSKNWSLMGYDCKLTQSREDGVTETYQQVCRTLGLYSECSEQFQFPTKQIAEGPGAEKKKINGTFSSYAAINKEATHRSTSPGVVEFGRIEQTLRERVSVCMKSFTDQGISGAEPVPAGQTGGVR